MEVLIVSNFWVTDRQLLGELPQLKYLDVQEIDDGQSFGSLEDEFGERIRIHYRALPLQFARNKIRSILNMKKIELDGVYIFNEEDFAFYHGCFEQVSEEIHFFTGFTIFDRCSEIESSFFGKFIDVTGLSAHNHTLSQEEMIRICGSFPNVKRFNGNDRLLSKVCPHLREYVPMPPEWKLSKKNNMKSIMKRNKGKKIKIER